MSISFVLTAAENAQEAISSPQLIQYPFPFFKKSLLSFQKSEGTIVPKIFANRSLSISFNSYSVGYNTLVKSFEEERKTEFSEETQQLINGLKEIRKRVMEEHDKRWKSGDVKIAERHREALHLISELQNSMYQDVRINLKTVEILAKYLKNELFEDTKKYLTILSQLVV